MSKPTYNNQTITEYLLGSLPEAETERFDELSITDDEFAETLKAAEKDLVDAYVQGELIGAELEQFKFHYLASPLRREKVQFAQAFQVLAEKRAPRRKRKPTQQMPLGARGKQKFRLVFRLERLHRTALWRCGGDLPSWRWRSLLRAVAGAREHAFTSADISNAKRGGMRSGSANRSCKRNLMASVLPAQKPSRNWHG